MIYLSSDKIQSFLERVESLYKFAQELAAQDKKMVNAETVLKVIRRYYPIDITRRTRQPEYSESRFVACYLLRRYTSLSLSEVAEKLNLRNHTTVLHACSRATELLEIRDDKITREVSELKKLIEYELLKDQETKGASQGTVREEVEDDTIKLKIA